ncbi:MAG: spondin domain-containing protein [Pseudomonadota bacterium]
MKFSLAAIGTTAIALASFGASAATVQITVTVENLTPENSVAFAPLRVGFHNGTFDAFNIGEVAGDAIISVAEGGSGDAWFPAFEAADPTATLGSVVPDPAGPLVPGATAVATFTVDTDVNQYFTFASMVVPSNDFFIGNDSPTQYQLFDGSGNLLLSEILVGAADIWDAGSEIFDPSAAAFVVGGDNDARTPQNSVVAFNFAELAAFNGLETGAGYIFDSQLTASSDVYLISFEVAAVPVPAALPLMGGALGLLGFSVRRRRTSAA